MRIIILISLFCISIGWALEETAFPKKKFDTPRREQAVIITDEGYYPKKLTIFEGEKIHFYVTSTMNSASCLLMPSHKLYISVQEGKMAEGDAFFGSAGKYTFYCPAGKIKGQIVVLERPLPGAEQENQRNIASTRVKVWRPREE